MNRRANGALAGAMRSSLVPIGLLALALGAAAPQDPRAELEAAFREQGIRLSLEKGWCSIPAAVCIREDLLEYVLVAPFGASHESLFSTEVRPSVLTTALVALGAEPGRNAEWRPIEPAPSDEALAAGAPAYEVTPPTGTGFHMYAAWREGEELYFFRVEDLISNLRTGRSMRRHEWVYLGSRMVKPRPESDEEVLAADLEGNLVNLSYFRAGNTLFTAGLDDCVYQTIWLPNAFLVPSRGTEVALLFSRERLAVPPPELAAALAPEPPEEQRDEAGGSGGER